MTAMGKITLEAPAKLNLWLEVMQKRPDGYHEIFTIMHTAGLCDTVELELAAAGIELSCVVEEETKRFSAEVPCGEANLAYRAATAFFSCASERAGVRIKLYKRIPAGTGLGGGSADAAAVLRGLNMLLGSPIPEQKLYEIGRALGADVPFCIAGGTMAAAGIGEKLTQCSPPPEFFAVIAVPKLTVNTGRAYAALDGIKYEYRDPAPFLKALAEGDREAFCAGLFNRFEDVIPSAKEIKKRLCRLGAAAALMSGSGSAVFGLFESRADAGAAAEALLLDGYFARMCNL